MRELTEAQIDRVCQFIEQEVSNEQLRVELIDHCCCLLEYSLDDSDDFDDALMRSVRVLAPDGLPAVEDELNYVLLSKTQKIMKRLLYFFGFLSAFFLMAGQTMKVMHWPYANVTVMLGASALILAMLTLLVNVLSRLSAWKPSASFRAIAGGLGGLCFGAGVLFKMLHLQGAGVLYVFGMFMITFIFVPTFFWHLYKREIAKS